ncbi:MAG TPA: hypothetical protein DCM86_14575 [Verrucomicrobiales bacterium]|nr:hypothetical protein [Verrucomicrobiales bacterium]
MNPLSHVVEFSSARPGPRSIWSRPRACFLLGPGGGPAISLLVGLLWVLCLVAGADTHIYVGAAGTNQGDPLLFTNGSLFDATRTNGALPQILRTNGLNAGYYRGDALTFSALAATPVNGGPVALHAALGARIGIQVTGLKGPPGGSFAFWEGDGESDLGRITFSLPVGSVAGTNLLLISENVGEAGADPYGHIHGREFTTSLAGTYLVGFRAVDLSTNGLGGGPIHSPSDVLWVRFQAGALIEAFSLVGGRVTVTFRSLPGITNALEWAGSLSPPEWVVAAPPLRGNNGIQMMASTNAPSVDGFYRLRQLNNLP